MIKNKTILEVKIGERSYCLECMPDSPLGEIFDALAKMQIFVMDKMKETQPKEVDDSKITPINSDIEVK